MSKGHRVIALLLVVIIALFVTGPASQWFGDQFVFTESMKQRYQWEKDFNATVVENNARVVALGRLVNQARTDASARRQLDARKKELDAEIRLIQLRSEWDLCAANPNCTNPGPRP
jgi:hypothetical protein